MFAMKFQLDSLFSQYIKLNGVQKVFEQFQVSLWKKVLLLYFKGKEYVF